MRWPIPGPTGKDTPFPPSIISNPGEAEWKKQVNMIALRPQPRAGIVPPIVLPPNRTPNPTTPDPKPPVNPEEPVRPLPIRGKAGGIVGAVATTAVGLVFTKGVGWFDSRKQALNDVEAAGVTLVGACRDWLISYQRVNAVANHNNAHAAFVLATTRAQASRRQWRRDLLQKLGDEAALMVREMNSLSDARGDKEITARQAVDGFEARLTEFRTQWHRRVDQGGGSAEPAE